MMFLSCREKTKLISQKSKNNSLQTRNNRFTPMDRLRDLSKVRASLFASKKASMTLEVSLVLPIFLFLMFSFLLFIEILCTQIHIGFTLSQISKELSQYTYAYEKMEKQNSEQGGASTHIPENMFTQMYIKNKLEGDIGKKYLDNSSIKNGSKGIQYTFSNFSQMGHITDIVVSYEIELPFPFFKIPNFPMIQRARTKGWTGYEKPGGEINNEEMVYITTTGTVYHKSSNCTHLKLSIQKVDKNEIVNLRNEQMGKYHSCEVCGEEENTTGIVYITDSGNRYHNTLSCSGLKRGISTIPISEVGGRNPCSRCGG